MLRLVEELLFQGVLRARRDHAARRVSNATSLSLAFLVFVRLTENIRIAFGFIHNQSILIRPHQKQYVVRILLT
jgi:hypothetical protein